MLVISNEVQELAERAQSDLGMGYAWLFDVTYEDWQVSVPTSSWPLSNLPTLAVP